jgi:hypothetical protein
MEGRLSVIYILLTNGCSTNWLNKLIVMRSNMLATATGTDLEKQG